MASEYVELLHSTQPVAKKEHVCMYCGSIIHIGEKYHRDTCSYDGRVYDWVTHHECREAADKLDMYGRMYGDGLDSNEFQEFIYDEANELGIDTDGKSVHDLVLEILSKQPLDAPSPKA